MAAPSMSSSAKGGTGSSESAVGVTQTGPTVYYGADGSGGQAPWGAIGIPSLTGSGSGWTKWAAIGGGVLLLLGAVWFFFFKRD